MNDEKLKGYKGKVKVGDTVYSIFDEDGKTVGPINTANSESDVITFMEKWALEMGRRLTLYRCTKVAESSHISYERYIKSDEWAKKAQAAKVRAGGKCQVCNSDENLDAHHRTYLRLGDERPEDITVLCRECHDLFHENGKLKR